jgi:hypothetical protein
MLCAAAPLRHGVWRRGAWRSGAWRETYRLRGQKLRCTGIRTHLGNVNNYLDARTQEPTRP